MRPEQPRRVQVVGQVYLKVDPRRIQPELFARTLDKNLRDISRRDDPEGLLQAIRRRRIDAQRRANREVSQ